jgi:hypothetical protein
METTIRERQARQRERASSNGAASSPIPIDRQTHTRPKRPATRTLYGCAREGCLEIARPGAQYCPLHA